MVIGWADNIDGSGSGIVGQRYNASGAPVGDPFQVNTYTDNDQIIPSVAMEGTGNFVAIEFTGERNAKLVAEIPRDNGLTATHFGSEPLENIVPVTQGTGASFA